jgi:hypothetical protein
MPFFEFEWTLKWVKYSQLILSPKDVKDKSKYLHAHRLDFMLPANIRLGIAETVIYGSTDTIRRSVEPVYLLPFVPYLFAQHYVGDRDNSGISLDFSIGTLPGFEFYGELFIDDLDAITSMFDDSWWGNKWGASLGVAAGPRKLGILEWDGTLEYTRIEPWVYTHHLGSGTQYSHYGQSIGGDLGPNSQEVYAALGLAWKQLLRLDLSVSAVAKDTARGGHISDIHDYDRDGEGKKFLNPASTYRYQAYTAGLRFSPWEFVWLQGSYTKVVGRWRGDRLEGSVGLEW